MKTAIQVQSETVINNEPRMFTDADFPVGTVAHQGDMILVRIDTLPKSAKARPNRQLAEGNTQGSRHIVEGGEVFSANAKDVVKSIRQATGKVIDPKYIGPLFTGPATVTHPEHGHHTYEGEMVIACVVQRNLDAEGREQRTKD